MTRILVVAHDALARAGLASLLVEHPAIEVVGRTAGDTRIVTELDIYRPEVVVWDLGWETEIRDLSSLAETIEIIPVIVLVATPESAAGAWINGLRGMLLRDTTVEGLIAAIQAAHEGIIAIDPLLVDKLMIPGRPGDPPTPQEDLTVREMEVLRLLAEGHSNKAIALRLEISEHTVKFHVNALMSKLGAQSRTEAVVRATRFGLISL